MVQHLETEPPEVDGWFEQMLKNLRALWAQTKHDQAGKAGRWACEIFEECSICNDHVSIACSLALEADTIGQLLNKNWAENEAYLFLQTYLRSLCEFVRNLKDVADLLSIAVDPPPKLVCIWGNRFAKHTLSLLVQHHPIVIMPESYGDAWKAFESRLRNVKAIDRHGAGHEISFIDRRWFGLSPEQQVQQANDERQAVVVLPLLADLLKQTIQYFRYFIDKCLENTQTLKKFESQHYCIGCW